MCQMVMVNELYLCSSLYIYLCVYMCTHGRSTGGEGGAHYPGLKGGPLESLVLKKMFVCNHCFLSN